MFNPKYILSAVFTILVILIIIIGISYFWYKEDFLIGLITNFLSIFVSVIIIEGILKYPEIMRWKKVENEIMSILKRELHGIFIDLRNLVKHNSVGIMSNNGTEEEMFNEIDKRNLIEISEKTEVSDVGKKWLQNSEKLFMYRANKLSNIEAKYFKFLKPNIISSLIRIQDGLNSMHTNTEIFKKQKGQYAFFSWFKSEDDYYKFISNMVNGIFKELRVIYEKEQIDFLVNSTIS